MTPKRGTILKVKYTSGYGKGAFRIFLVEGSTVLNPSGTTQFALKNGDVIEFDSVAFDGTVWFKYKGKSVCYQSNGWCNFLDKNLVPIITLKKRKQDAEKIAERYQKMGVNVKVEQTEVEVGIAPTTIVKRWAVVSNK